MLGGTSCSRNNLFGTGAKDTPYKQLIKLDRPTRDQLGTAALAARDEAAIAGQTSRRLHFTILAVSAAFWLCVMLLMVFIGVAIAASLGSGLLGFLGADLVFLIAMSIFTSGQGRAGRNRR